MRDEFKGYYAPTEAEYQTLWKEGLVVLDTNVILDLYRLPATARDEFLELLEFLKERLWVPHQVALEFQRRRLSVISGERKATEEALSGANDLFEEVRKRVSSLQVDKRGVGVQAEPLITDLKAANDRLIAAINTVHEAQLDIAAKDPIRDRLDLLLAGRVGLGPASQAELAELTDDGQQRYDRKIPPGYADADKERNPAEAMFYHDGIAYERKFGDLIIWRQLLRHVKKQPTSAVLLVTADRKEDWWWREKGKTIGPRPELSREITQLGDVKLFWMYSSAQFLETARRFTTAEVSESSVSELKDVSRTSPEPPLVFRYGSHSRGATNADVNQVRAFPSFSELDLSVLNWLRRKYEDVAINKDFPDFIVNADYGPHGFEVKYLRTFSQMLVSPSVVNAMLRGYVEVNEGRLAEFTIVIIVREDELVHIQQSRKNELSRRFASLVRKYPVSELVLGYTDEKGEFIPALTEIGRQDLTFLPE